MIDRIFIVLFVLDIQLLHTPLFIRIAKSQLCSPVQLNPEEVVPKYCSVFKNVCVDHGSRIVLHEERYQIDNVQRENTPVLPHIK